jgi:hypothetical protein
MERPHLPQQLQHRSPQQEYHRKSLAAHEESENSCEVSPLAMGESNGRTEKGEEEI